MKPISIRVRAATFDALHELRAVRRVSEFVCGVACELTYDQLAKLHLMADSPALWADKRPHVRLGIYPTPAVIARADYWSVPLVLLLEAGAEQTAVYLALTGTARLLECGWPVSERLRAASPNAIIGPEPR